MIWKEREKTENKRGKKGEKESKIFGRERKMEVGRKEEGGK